MRAEDRLEDFQYELPERLIARRPVEPRTACRLLVLDGATGERSDRRFAELPDLLSPGDLLVLNDTRVIPARLYGRKDSGGRIEVMLERVLDRTRVLVQIGASRVPLNGQSLTLDGGAAARVAGRRGRYFELEFDRPVLAHFEAHGHVPLPPYLERDDDEADRSDYQTVYASEPGAVAAPTAGLHFDPPLLETLEARDIRTARITLHVGSGTFLPVTVDNLRRRRLHAERVRIGPAAVAEIEAARRRGGRVVAVGTTSLRALESAAGEGGLRAFEGETELFVTPGYRFRVVDALITNFHLPGSSLLMLVAAFAGTREVLDAYRHAVEQGYRFYSYGDAMLVLPRADALAPRAA